MTTRRLAAILAADVVGFSALMEQDEEGTLARIMAERRETVPFIMSGSLRESPWRSGHVFAAFPARYPNIRAELFKAPGRLASGLATWRAAFPDAK